MRRMLEVPSLYYTLVADTRMSWLWLVVRVYLGYEWFTAGWEKLMNPAWFGSGAGAAISGFAQGALGKTAEFCANPAACHPDVQWWYADFIRHTLVAQPLLWSHLITLGELAVGAELILGAFTGLAALSGVFMNLNFMLAGAVSVNPIWAAIGIGIVLARRVAGHLGADRWIAPYLRRLRRSGG